MSGAVCPSCGVPVVPGYVRCPKCHKALPPPRRASTVTEGGTAVPSSNRVPMFAALGGAVLAIGGVVYLAVRGDDRPSASAEAPASETEAEDPTNQLDDPPRGGPEPFEPPSPGPATANPGAIANELRAALQRQRLWSTVTVIGDRVEVRSGSCGEPAMTAMLDDAAASFKAAGLTRLRCLEQSGRVVSDRDL
jgi:hypothetical protein